MRSFKQFVNEAVLGERGGKVTQTPGSVRNLPLSQGLVSTIERGLAGTGLNWHSYSGGQPAAGSGGKRVGSTRHDNGRASDGYFKDAVTGKTLDGNNPQDRERISVALGKLRQAGIQGIGWGPGYMGTKNFHLDIVTPEIWGEGGRSANAHSWVVTAAGGSVTAPASGGVANQPSREPGAPEGDEEEENELGDEESDLSAEEKEDIGSLGGLTRALKGVAKTFTTYGQEL